MGAPSVYVEKLMTRDSCVRFSPSRVEGLPDVSEAVVYPDRVELKSGSEWLSFRFVDIARWPRPAWLWKVLFRLGSGPRWLPIADRDWFHDPSSERFFSFYTKPRIVVHMPNDEPAEGYAETYFVRIQLVILRGGFSTVDLG